MSYLDRIAEEAIIILARTKLRGRISPELLRRAREGRCLYCAQPIPEDGLGGRDGYCSHVCRRRGTC